MKTTRYFSEQVLAKRSYLTLEVCEKVVKNAVKKEVQEDGRIRYWGYVEGLEKALRVVVLEDDETIHNAFLDRGFKEK